MTFTVLLTTRENATFLLSGPDYNFEQAPLENALNPPPPPLFSLVYAPPTLHSLQRGIERQPRLKFIFSTRKLHIF